MPATSNNLLQHVKKSCDNDTLLFHFKGNAGGEAFQRNALYTPWPTDNNIINQNNTYYHKIIMPRLNREMALNIFYKNNNGVWIDYMKCVTSYPKIALPEAAVLYENYIKIDINKIPRCIYMDGGHYIHYIDEHDGLDNDVHLPIINIDSERPDAVEYRSYSIQEPHLSFSMRHLMNDLQVKVNGFKASSLLVNVNGIFVPIIPDTVYEDTFYIQNALTAIGSKCINQKINAPWDYKDKEKNATVVEDESFNEYRLDIRLRLFTWKDVLISPWYAPLLTEKIPITHNFTNLYIVNKILFSQPVNKDAHMIFDNGILLDPCEYEIDLQDPRKITLKNVIFNVYELLREVIQNIRENLDFYQNVKPLSLLAPLFTNRVYSLVNFSTPDENKKLFLKRSIACATDFPYKNEVTFSDIQIGDLIMVNGTFNEYEWINKNTVYYPKFRLYNSKESTIRENEVCRLYFILK
jgi:hypothetical protein